MKNLGIVRKIDDLGRLVIPKEIRKNLNIKNNEDVEIFLDNECIILKKIQKLNSINDIINKYMNDFSKVGVNNIIITDKEKIIFANNKELILNKINNEYINLINERKIIEDYKILIGNNILDNYYYFIPIIIENDSIGSILMFSDTKIKNEDKTLLNVISIIFKQELC